MLYVEKVLAWKFRMDFAKSWFLRVLVEGTTTHVAHWTPRNLSRNRQGQQIESTYFHLANQSCGTVWLTP